MRVGRAVRRATFGIVLARRSRIAPASVVLDIRNAVDLKGYEAYDSAYRRLADLHALSPVFERRRTFMRRLTPMAPKWAAAIDQWVTPPRGTRPARIDERGVDVVAVPSGAGKAFTGFDTGATAADLAGSRRAEADHSTADRTQVLVGPVQARPP